MRYEWIGILGSIAIIIAFTFKDTRKIRIADAIGAALFIVYGVLIGSFSNVLLNAVLIGVQVWRLATDGKRQESCEG